MSSHSARNLAEFCKKNNLPREGVTRIVELLGLEF